MRTKVLVAPVGSLEAHCAGLALQREGLEVTCLPTEDVDAVLLFAADDAAVSAAELFEDERDRPLLMLSPTVDDSAIARARRAGAAGLLAWDTTTRRVVAAVTGLVAGERLLPPVSRQTDPLRTLTARERDIAELLRDGASNEAIATNLGISYHTVRTHVAHVLGKLGVTHRYAVTSMMLGSERLPAPSSNGATAGGAA